jgi:hypothetical protein
MGLLNERFIVAVLRWTARAIGIAILLLFFLHFFIFILRTNGDIALITLAQDGMLFVAELIIAIGLIVAWKWECLGSILILGGTAFAGIINCFVYPDFFVLIAILLLTVFLFLCCWWRTPKRTSGRRIIAGTVLLMILVGSPFVLNAVREWVICRDCERVISWVRSNHPAPGRYPDLHLPEEFRWLSINGGVDAVVLKDGRVILLLKTSIGWKENWRGVIYTSSPFEPCEMQNGSYGGRSEIYISDTPQGNNLLESHFIETKMNDRLYFAAFDLN